MFNNRETRPRPQKDDKIITSWNGLMIAALAKAYQVLGKEKYLNAAKNAANFIKKYLYIEKKLKRRYRDGDARFDGMLDDYAYLIDGLIVLYESDFNEIWIDWAIQLQEIQDTLFYDYENCGYFYAPKEAKELVSRQKDFYDSSIPNANAVSSLNLLKLYHLTFKTSYKQKAESLLKLASKFIEKSPMASIQYIIAIDFYLDTTKEIAVILNNIDSKKSDIIRLLYKTYLPNRVIAGAYEKSFSHLPILKEKTLLGKEVTLHICDGGICKYPTDNPNIIKQLLDDRKFYQLT